MLARFGTSCVSAARARAATRGSTRPPSLTRMGISTAKVRVSVCIHLCMCVSVLCI